MPSRARRTRRRASSPRARRGRSWARLSDEDLLDLPLRDLGLSLEGSPVDRELARLYRELARRGLGFRPHAWVAQEWFSPDGVPGIAVAFHLLHPRLRRLERRFMGEVEGGNAEYLMRILRHEAGHAVDTAYRLRRRKEYRELFGSPSRRYPRRYRPWPGSKRFVQHLEDWYAQSHPAEDFAETFAEWLRPGAAWRRRYAGWPALKKLQYVERTMAELRGERPPVQARHHIEPLRSVPLTLRQHYAAKLRHYGRAEADRVDAILKRVFARARPGSRRMRASTFLRLNGPRLRRRVARRLEASEYAVREQLDLLVERSRALRLRVRGDRRRAARRAERLLVVLTRKSQRGPGPWLAL
ncbi:MAG TPA: putative zinc-binding metallopeptidase [Anaeromyxobacteraceae bacterium]|nr:putative zinc-binding metallopeptidase [Anaeromyxobacteraceae bacterium]